MSGDGLVALLPQTGVARLLTGVQHSDATSIRATGAIARTHPLASGDRAPSYLAIELGAQAAAALTALNGAHDAPAPLRGRLVRVRTAAFAHATLPVETPLEVTARLVAVAPPLAVYEIEVGVDGTPHVTATLSTYALPARTAA